MRALSAVYSAIIIGLAAVSGLILAAICLLIIVDVGLRNLGFQPLQATIALNEYALLYFTMFAAPYLARTRGHVVVRVLYDRLSVAPKRILENSVYLLCITVSFCIAYVSGALVVESWIMGDVEQRSIDLPRWALFAPLCIGFFFVGCEFLRFLLSPDSFYATPDDAAHTQERY